MPKTDDKNLPIMSIEEVDLKKTDIKEASDQVLGWNRKSPDYMDKSHGTEVGDDMPFDGPEARNIDDADKKVTDTGEEKNGTIHEETSMIDSENDQNSPDPGVGEGPSDEHNKPFDAEKGRQIDEAIDDLDMDADLELSSIDSIFFLNLQLRCITSAAILF